MESECDQTLRTVYTALGRLPASFTITANDLEVAFRHVLRCRRCKEALSPTERGNFISGVVLERE